MNVAHIVVVLFIALVCLDGILEQTSAGERNEVTNAVVGGGMVMGLTIGVLVDYSNALNLARQKPSWKTGSIGVLLGVPTIVGGTWVLDVGEGWELVGALIVVVGATSTILGSLNLLDSIGDPVERVNSRCRLTPIMNRCSGHRTTYGFSLNVSF
jgi:hypothetical protein